MALCTWKKKSTINRDKLLTCKNSDDFLQKTEMKETSPKQLFTVLILIHVFEMIKFMNEESSIPMVQQPHNQTTYIHTHVGEVAKGSLGLLEGANISLKFSILKVSYALHPRHHHQPHCLHQPVVSRGRDGIRCFVKSGSPGKTRSPETKMAAVDLEGVRTKIAFRSSTLTDSPTSTTNSIQQSMVFNHKEPRDLQTLRKTLEFTYNCISMVLRINVIIPFEINVD